MSERKGVPAAKKKTALSFAAAILGLAAVCLFIWLLGKAGGRVTETYVNDEGEEVTVSYVTRATENRYPLFEAALERNGIAYTKEESVTAASIDGVIDGVRYSLEDGRGLQIFRFDIESDAYRQAVRQGRLWMPSVGQSMRAYIKDDYAMIPDDYQDMIPLFENLK